MMNKKAWVIGVGVWWWWEGGRGGRNKKETNKVRQNGSGRSGQNRTTLKSTSSFFFFSAVKLPYRLPLVTRGTSFKCLNSCVACSDCNTLRATCYSESLVSFLLQGHLKIVVWVWDHWVVKLLWRACLNTCSSYLQLLAPAYEHQNLWEVWITKIVFIHYVQHSILAPATMGW